MSVEIITVTLPASWAPALINGDWSGLEYYDPEGAAEARHWLKTSGLEVLSCGDESFVARYDGLLTDCLEYYCKEVQQ